MARKSSIVVSGTADDLSNLIIAITTFQHLATTDQLPEQCGPAAHQRLTRAEALEISTFLNTITFRTTA